jgi:hypothetical protein
MGWWHNMQQGDEFRPPFHAPTHRAIFDDEDLYASHARWSIASYLIVRGDRFTLDPNKRVYLSPHNSSWMDAVSIQPLIHSLYLWYYPGSPPAPIGLQEAVEPRSAVGHPH